MPPVDTPYPRQAAVSSKHIDGMRDNGGMIQAALSEAWERIARERSRVGEFVLPNDPTRALIATAYDDATEQSLYVQPLEALTQTGAPDDRPVVYARPRLPDGDFGEWRLRAVP